MTSEPPVEPDDGQDPKPPDTGLAVLVATLLLSDLRDHLRRRHDDAERELLLRIGAVLAVLHRLRKHLDES